MTDDKVGDIDGLVRDTFIAGARAGIDAVMDVFRERGLGGNDRFELLDVIGVLKMVKMRVEGLLDEE